LQHGQKVLLLARAAEATFSSSDWVELGYVTGIHDWIDRHPRLIRSLSWGDPDYRGHVIDAMGLVLREPENLRKLIEYPPIGGWLAENEAGALAELRAEVTGVQVEHVPPQVASDAAIAALADAQTLLRERGPTSALDRVHTGLHGFLRAGCDQAGIEYPPDASANALLRKLLDEHPGLADLGPRSADVRRVIQTSSAIVDALGTLRNRATLAHPNEELVGDDEALLVINVTRSLIAFLDAKLVAR
jgi:hypothetical protein